MYRAVYKNSGFSLLELIGGLLIIVLGIGMNIWARKERKTFGIALADHEAAQEANAREDQINIQAEAILRAEQLKKERGL